MSYIQKYNIVKANTVVIIFLCAITLRYPLLLLYPFPGGPMVADFYATDLSIISTLSLFMILISDRLTIFFEKKNKLFIISLLTFLLIAVIQFFYFNNYTFREFTFAISWVVIPLSIYIYAETFQKFLIPYFAFLWCFNAIYAVPQLYHMNESIGIPANRNWHGGFILGCTPIFIFALYRALKYFKIPQKFIYLMLTVPILFSAVILYRCYSRGANLSLIVTIIILLVIWLNIKKPKNYKRIMVISTLGLITIGIASLLVYGDKIASLMLIDVRIPLWRGALDLFFDNLPIGVGSPSYESHYAYHIPIDRFIRSWYFTYRSDHPHNHLLYLVGSFGLLGGIALLYLWLYPIIFCCRKFKTLSFNFKLIFISFLLLSLHSLFDLIIFRWPTVFMALILQGILWKLVFSDSQKLNQKQIESKEQDTIQMSRISKYGSNIVLYCTAFYILYVGYAMTYDNIYGSLYCRTSLQLYRKTKPYSFFYCEKSLKTNMNTRSIYNAGKISLFDLNDHLLALKYFKLLETHPAKIIAHANSYIADCYIRMNRNTEALEYIENDVKVFPIGVLSHYKKIYLEKKLKRLKQADKTAQKLHWIIQIKNLTPEDIDRIRRHPELDGKYHLLKETNNEQ